MNVNMVKDPKLKLNITIQKQFGERVRVLRVQAGLSQEEFAFRCGMHRTYLSDIERGERNVALRNIEAISRAFGISLSVLFNFEIIPKIEIHNNETDETDN